MRREGCLLFAGGDGGVAVFDLPQQKLLNFFPTQGRRADALAVAGGIVFVALSPRGAPPPMALVEASVSDISTPFKHETLHDLQGSGLSGPGTFTHSPFGPVSMPGGTRARAGLRRQSAAAKESGEGEEKQGRVAAFDWQTGRMLYVLFESFFM